ncbi:MAG: hypothetical protein KC457_11905, partial [Myxococcales bacterium]|nr:hypothetical protein [Myxococcales bacterium]
MDTVVLEPVGQARRQALDDGRERWELPAALEGRVEELLALGAAGLGGFVEGGVGESGPWLVREVVRRRLHDALEEQGDEPAPWRPVVEVVAAIARRLREAEARGCFPGLVGPHGVVLSPGEPWLLADELIAAELGGAKAGDTGAALRREWLTPSAAEGRAADAEDNRWLLGLLLYRWLTGRGPFTGMGLRAAIEQLRRGVPPLPDAVARSLPPGLQAAILRMLDPDPARRFSSAAEIVERLESFLHEGEARPVEARVRIEDAAPTPAVPKPIEDRPRRKSVRRRGGPLRAALVLATVTLGIVGGVGLLDGAAERLGAGQGEADREKESFEAPPVGERPPLDAAHTSPEDCASCHPRQTAEWKRSVMGHSAKSPLFQGLEILIEEQVGRSDDCPGGAGVLRSADINTACRDPNTDIAITGSGGALWCVNCHTPRENLGAVLPAWDGVSSRSATRRPLRDLQPNSTTEGIDCGFCHQVHGPVQPGNERLGRYEGNPSWISTVTGQLFSMRPEDRLGLGGIANSGYLLDPGEFLAPDSLDALDAELVPGEVHRRPSPQARAYLQSSQFCGACHDVRLFGSDAIATPDRGEHFRRLRNAYSEWVDWGARERRLGREPSDCQDCHMSSFPGVCVAGDPIAAIPGETDITALRRGCPPGTHFESRAPGEFPQLRVAAGSGDHSEVTTHYFSGVDIPLTP